jgi:hypothetical protein
VRYQFSRVVIGPFLRVIGRPKVVGLESGHLAGEPQARARRAVADDVMRAIGELSGQEYVHLYASDVKAKLSGEDGG